MTNDSRCVSIKTRYKTNERCENLKKFGEYCGVHNRCKEKIHFIAPLRASTPQLDNVLKKNTEMKCIESLYYEDLDILIKMGIEEIKYDKLIKTLVYYNIQITGSKRVLVDILIKYMKGRELIKKAYENPELCNNPVDFYDFVGLKEIPVDYLFIFICVDDHLYGMDLRSLHTYFVELEKEARLLEKPVNYINPYNRYKLSSITKYDYNRRLINLINKKMPLLYPDVEANPKEKLEFKAVEIFHMMSTYGYPLDAQMFLRLEKAELLKFYEVMEDMWNRRYSLLPMFKRSIVPNDMNIFSVNEYHQIKTFDKLPLQELLIKKIEKMISTGIDREHRIHGIHYVLLGLGEVGNYSYLEFGDDMDGSELEIPSTETLDTI